VQGLFASPLFPSDPSDLVEVLEQFSFLHLHFEIAFLILNTAEDFLYVVHFDLVEEQDQEDEMDG
jgi:hypothetical protein